MGNTSSCCALGNRQHIADYSTSSDKKLDRKDKTFAHTGRTKEDIVKSNHHLNSKTHSSPQRRDASLRVKEESISNLQHISEREPDDWEEDPSLHPTTETLFMEKSKESIQSKYSIVVNFSATF